MTHISRPATVFLVAFFVLFNAFALMRAAPINTGLQENYTQVRGDYDRRVDRIFSFAKERAEKPFFSVPNRFLFHDRSPGLFMFVSEAAIRLGANSPFPIQLLSIGFFNVGLWFCFLWVRNVFDSERMAALSLAFLLTTAFLLYHSSSIHHGPLAFLFFQLTLYCFSRFLGANVSSRWLWGTAACYLVLCLDYWTYYISAFLMLIVLQLQAGRFSWQMTAKLGVVPILAAGLTIGQVIHTRGYDEGVRRIADIAAASKEDWSIENSDWFPDKDFIYERHKSAYPRLVARRVAQATGHPFWIYLVALVGVLVLTPFGRWRELKWLPLTLFAGVSWNLVMVQHTVIQESSGMYGYFAWMLLVAALLNTLWMHIETINGNVGAGVMLTALAVSGLSCHYLPALRRYALNIRAGEVVATIDDPVKKKVKKKEAKKTKATSNVKRDSTRAQASRSTDAPANTPVCDGCNVLIVLIDALRADHLPCYGYIRDTAPNLCVFAEENIRFEHLFANGPSTKPSVASLFTSTFPRQHNTVRNNQKLSSRFETLAEVLQKDGFDTVGVNANPVIGKKFGYAQGFRRWVDLDRTTAAEVNHNIAGELKKIGKPFFLYVHYLDPHNPYSAPAPYDTYFNRGLGTADIPRGGFPRAVPSSYTTRSLELLKRMYDNEIRYVDDAFGKLIEMLKVEHLYDDTVVMVLSDHGEQFGEHGFFYHSNGVHTEVIDVPLFLRIPGDIAGGVVMDAYVQHTDLLPTLTKILNAKDDAPRMGRSVFDVPARRPVILQHLRRKDLPAEGIVDGSTKFIRRLRVDEPLWRLYNIETDSEEKRDLLANSGSIPVAESLNAKLTSFAKRQRTWVQKHFSIHQDDEGESVKLETTDIAKLRALGYVQ